MAFYDSTWKDCKDTERSTGSCIVFYQGIPIDYCIHVPGPFNQYSDESEQNSAFIAGIDLATFVIINNEITKNDPDVFPGQAPIIILDIKSDVFMSNNGKDTKHTIYIYRRMHFVRNGEE